MMRTLGQTGVNCLYAFACRFGNTGDANALQRLVEAEKNLSKGHGAINQPIVAPDVGPKQPTTAGPKIHRYPAPETPRKQTPGNLPCSPVLAAASIKATATNRF